MKKYFMGLLLVALLVTGCTPKIGEDILIEPQGNIRFDSSGPQMVMGILTLLGIGDEKGRLRLGSDLKVVNRWHSDLKLVSLTYSLDDGKESLAKGEALINKHKPMVVESGKEKIIPLLFSIDPKGLENNRVVGVLQGKRKLMLRGDIVVEVWGIQKHYPFEKEATKLVQKALNGVL
jgi:hypothetical protein